jgi:hypothetical protein
MFVRQSLLISVYPHRCCVEVLVLLMEALAGGWDRSSLPRSPECCGRLVSDTASP